MFGQKKQAEQLKSSEVTVGDCPVCKAYVSHIYFMQDAKTKQTSKWYSCACGTVFQVDKPTKIYDKKYWDDCNKFDKKTKDAYEYVIRIYIPIIEELIYGHRVLIIGSPNLYQVNEFKSRGWVPTVIDKNTSLKMSDNLIADDFEKHKFPEDQKYNLIWIYHTLECFSDPIASLELCKTLLAEDGIIFIATPDTDFINTRSSSGFIHWKPEMNYLMWNRRSLTNHLEKLGFNVIFARQNYEHRFPIWDDLHLIAQKKFF